LIRVHLLIKGRVQGVGYRANARRRAYQLDLKGWVRNLRDGSVEALVEGKKEQVDKFVRWCHRGPTMAHVQSIQVTEEEPTGEFSGFHVRRD
jgi:acylphosphatase